MIAVADASPICYLVWMGEIGLLPELLERELLPSAVFIPEQERSGFLWSGSAKNIPSRSVLL